MRGARRRRRRPDVRAAAWSRDRGRAARGWWSWRGQLDGEAQPGQLGAIAGSRSLTPLLSQPISMRRSEPLVLLAVGAIALIVSAINPADRTTWWLEVFPIFIAVPVLIATARRF